ncbi:MAG: cupredoxin domain-containing protein [Armatimonadota bacterium]|nr:cupredoxin domain-containing protein [Armatimonadota bacterium]MDR7547970.1 cupredoxin domain-containing protein [Armatimonadota bacterium]MDR7552838.1 cupredoxin domain-containing protein [Armatimonadota bacterium]MDR7558675.1 cupredoxin domain-containing protein [Armatimonadota bacterium]MDR7573104.1 cupredoxin domain-containing protein [Armatimonadota bacterium]
MVVLVAIAFGQPSAAAVASVSPIVVEMTEFRFRPTTILLRAGRPAVIRLVNRGQIAHQFQAAALHRLPVTVVDTQTRIEAPGLEILRLQPGATATLSFVPRAGGRMPFACTIEGHQEAGMTGALVVR